MARETLEEEISIFKKMSQIEVFPGSLEEYENMKKEQYRIIDIPGHRKYLIGGINAFTKLKEGDISLSNKFYSLLFTANQGYHEILRQAAELEAVAIIRYQITSNKVILYEEMGIPVKRK